MKQITSVLQQVTAGMAVGDVCRQVGISEQTFYRCVVAPPHRRRFAPGIVPDELLQALCGNIARVPGGPVRASARDREEPYD